MSPSRERVILSRSVFKEPGAFHRRLVPHHLPPRVIHCRVTVFRITYSGLQNFEATRQRWDVYDFYFNIILILNVSQDLTIKLVIYVFQRYLTIKLLKIQIQISSYR